MVAHGHEIFRHDVAAPEIGQLALISAELGVLQQGLEIFTTDVENLVVAGKHGVQVGVHSFGFFVSGLICTLSRRAVWVRAPGDTVVEHSDSHQKDRIHEHRRECELQILDSAQSHHQGGCASRWMQTSKSEHQGNGKAHCERGSEFRVTHPTHTSNSEQCRQRIAGHHRPGLRQGAGGNGEYQHRTGAEWCNQPGPGRPRTRKRPTYQRHCKDAQRSTHHDPQAFAPVSSWRGGQ
ncbi:hypothetical protein FQZ97_905270 [compost metagenome]